MCVEQHTKSPQESPELSPKFKMASKMAAVFHFHHNFTTRQDRNPNKVSNYMLQGTRNLIQSLSRAFKGHKYPKPRWRPKWPPFTIFIITLHQEKLELHIKIHMIQI